jgi:glycosyltransferase involved in cell wall biosynthesis
MVIVCDGERQIAEITSYVRYLGLANVKIIGFPEGSMSLGALRNVAVGEATGEILCQWDDDDLYHPDRLLMQVSYMLERGCSACFLSDQLQLFTGVQKLYWCDWSQPRSQPSWPPVIPNTLLCERSAAVRYPELGECANRSEDLFFAVHLCRRVRVAVYSGVGFLYIYVSHGSNTWNDNHHRKIVATVGLDAAELLRRRSVLERELRRYALEWPVAVSGFDDKLAFDFEPSNAEEQAGSAPLGGRSE